MREIYIDNGATTKIRDEVFMCMTPFLKEHYGNASSSYSMGRFCKKALEDSRQEIASCIGANKDEIFFTSCGTEANNWAIIGTVIANNLKGKHIITTKVEHLSVLNVFKKLEKRGYEVTYLEVDTKGNINLQQLKNAIKKDTILISIMFANNEIGTIFPIKQIGDIAKQNNIIFHTDAVQAIGHIDIDTKLLNIDLMTVSAHKIYGPKGVGALFIKQGTKIKAMLCGGSQEKGKRAGTENIANIVGFAAALKLVTSEIKIENSRLTMLRDTLTNDILKNIPMSYINGDTKNRLSNNINICFKNVPADVLLLRLDLEGIFASSGSACSSGAIEASHVLLAIGKTKEEAISSIRMSLGYFNTQEEVTYIFNMLKKIVESIRDTTKVGG
jgi:cysteine desulfurase